MTNFDKIMELNRDKVIEAIQSIYCINPETFELVDFSNLLDMDCDNCIWHKMAMERGGTCDDDYAKEWLNKEIKAESEG